MAPRRSALPYSAGVYEQGERGWILVEWSRHSRRDLAEAAARRYRHEVEEQMGSRPGGLYSWSAWWRKGDEPEHEVGPQD